MVSELTIDAAGRVTLPKALRQKLHLEPGDSLRLVTRDDEITLQPVRASAPIKKEDGIWVYRSGQAPLVSIRDIVEEDRESRHDSILGLNR